MKAYLECIQGKNRSFWQIEVDGAAQTTTSGKLGSKTAPKQQVKTLKSAEAAVESAKKEVAKKKAAFYFDPSTIEGLLEAHLAQLSVPTEEEVGRHRASLPYASEDYLRVYRTGALSIGFLQEFAPTEGRMDGAFGETTGVFCASSAADELGEEGRALDPYFYVVGHYPDGSAVVQFNQGKHAGCLGLIEHGVNDDLVEHLVEGDVDATVAAWLEHGLMDSVSTTLFSEWVLRALMHYKGGAVERTHALVAAIAAVKEAIGNDPGSITTLDLCDKSLRVLPQFLSECHNLEVLRLRKNELGSVPAIVRTMKKLKELDLYYNGINVSALPAWLSELPIRSLNLGINDGGALAPVVCEITGLEELTLPQLEGIPASIGNLVNLRRLEVDGVKGPIEDGGLGRLEKLEHLELGDITQPLPSDIGGMHALQVLKFGVTTKDGYPLPASISKLQSLRLLHAGSSTLTAALGELRALEELKVAGNEHGLPSNFGSLLSLRKLDFNYARMTRLPESFGDLKSLEHLNLESTYLEALPASFGNLKNLRFLNLIAATPTNVGNCLGALENLEHLAMSVRVLMTAGDSLRNLRKLETLKVLSNSEEEADLRVLLEFISELPSLKNLAVSYNYKDHFRKTFPGLTIS